MAEYEPGKPVPARWWIPEQEDTHKAHGLYEIQDSGFALATAHQSIHTSSGANSAFEEEDPPLIHGEVLGKYVTLLKPVLRASKRPLGGSLAQIEYRPRLALEGLLIGSDQLSVTDAKVIFHDQDVWAQPKTIESSIDSSGESRNIRIVDQLPQVAVIPGGKIEVEAKSSWRIKEREASISSYSMFRISLDAPCPIEDFMKKWILPLEIFIATATGRVGGVELLKVTNREWGFAEDTLEHQRWARVRVASKVLKSENRKKINAIDTLFTLQDMNWPEQGPLAFAAISNLEYVTEHWAMLLSPKYGWPIARFVSSVQAIEALDRALHPEEYAPLLDKESIDKVLQALSDANLTGKIRVKVKNSLKRKVETTLDQRMQRLAVLSDPVMTNMCPESDWPGRIARLRHIVSHGLPEARDLSIDVRPVQVATIILLHLLEGTLLRQLGFEGQQLERIIERRSNFSYRRNVLAQDYRTLPLI